jgi:YacP-like NYN domain
MSRARGPLQVLVDAQNALHRFRLFVEDDPATGRDRLVRRTHQALRDRARGEVARVTLVFDAHPDAQHAGRQGGDGRVRWRFARGTADEAILERLRDDVRHRLLVVTDDRELAGRARQLGARSEGLHAFYGDAPADRPPPPARHADTTDLRAADFGLPEGPIDLGRTDPEAL